MRKLFSVLMSVGMLAIMSQAMAKNPKDALSDDEYFKLRTCKSEQKEQEITHNCRDAYSMRAILKGEQEELKENGQEDSMFRIFNPANGNN